MKTTHSFFALLLCLAACSSPERTVWDRNATELEVRTMLTDYHDAMKEHGIKAEFDYLDNSPEFFWVAPGYTTALTYDSVRSILEVNDKLYTSIDLSWETLDIHPLSPDIASYTGIVKGNWTDTSGVTLTMRLIESGTIIQRANGWKLLSGQSRVLDPSDSR